MNEQKNLEAIRKAIISRDETLAIAESVTSGHLQAALPRAEEATYFYHGGITVYNLEQKTRHLGVDPIAADTTNSVAPRIAQTMAEQVCSFAAIGASQSPAMLRPFRNRRSKIRCLHTIPLPIRPAKFMQLKLNAGRSTVKKYNSFILIRSFRSLQHLSPGSLFQCNWHQGLNMDSGQLTLP
jgi:hypothetical protein